MQSTKDSNVTPRTSAPVEPRVSPASAPQLPSRVSLEVGVKQRASAPGFFESLMAGTHERPPPPPAWVSTDRNPDLMLWECERKTSKVSPELQVKQQASAPSYFASLSQNPAPPFLLPGKEARPRLLIGTIMTEREAVEMIAAAGAPEPHGLSKFINHFIVEKNITENFNLSERQFLTSLVCEVTDYAAQRDFSAFKLSLLITLYLDTHLYFKWFYWLSPRQLWDYFMENLIRHTIEDSPDGQKVFEPDESYDILSHFHTIYVSNLPLVHLASFGATRLRVTWPFKHK